jgi:hypothetical protein
MCGEYRAAVRFAIFGFVVAELSFCRMGSPCSRREVSKVWKN